MLRYFVAWNFWLAFALVLMLAKGDARVAPTFYTVFGVGWIRPELFWAVVAIALAAAAGCALAWRRTLPRTAA